MLGVFVFPTCNKLYVIDSHVRCYVACLRTRTFVKTHTFVALCWICLVQFKQSKKGATHTETESGITGFRGALPDITPLAHP